MICTWNGCPHEATRNLGFGRYDRRSYRAVDVRESHPVPPMQAQNHRRGKVLTVVYCESHAAVARDWFHVEHDRPLTWDAAAVPTPGRHPRASRTGPLNPVYHMACVEAGLTRREIAALTGRSIDSLSDDRERIIASFGAVNMTQALARFVRSDMGAAA